MPCCGAAYLSSDGSPSPCPSALRPDSILHLGYRIRLIHISLAPPPQALGFWVLFQRARGVKTPENPQNRPSHPPPSKPAESPLYQYTSTYMTYPPAPVPEGANCSLGGPGRRPARRRSERRQAPLSAICCTKGPSSGAKSPISGYALGMHGMYSISPHLFANKLQTNRHANSKPGHGCAAPARLRRAKKPANRTHPPTPHGQHLHADNGRKLGE